MNDSEVGPPAAGGRDRLLAEDVREVLNGESLLRAAPFAFDVRGGVVHLRGRIASRQAQARLRRVLGRLRGVQAVWDLLQIDGSPPPRVIDLGCGPTKQVETAVGLDRHAWRGVDLVADLERPLPIADASVDHVFAVHFLEHVRELLPLVNELHRILEPTGVLHVMVPHREHVNAWADPTHVRYFDPQTFKFLCKPYPGLRPFHPLLVTCADGNILADLQPVGEERPLATAEELARFFD